MYRAAALMACLSLGGCQSFYAATGAFAGVNVASVAVIGRSVPDAVVSLIRNRDCSIVRLEQGRSYCVPPDPPLPPAAFCTSTLGTVDCWARPDLLPLRPTALADTPPPTPEQVAHSAHRWPDAW